MANKIDKSIFQRSGAAGETHNSELTAPPDAAILPVDAASSPVIDASLIREVQNLVKAVKAGQLGTRANLNGFHDANRLILENVNEMLNAVIEPLNVTAVYVDRIGHGEIPPKITEDYHGDFNNIKNNLNNCIESLEGLSEICSITNRVVVNDFTKKIEGQYHGIYADTAHSLNTVIDRWLSVQTTITRISEGDLGLLQDLKAVGKRCEQDEFLPAFIALMENIQGMVNEALRLTQAAKDGQLDTRADLNKFQGEYRSVLEGVNNTLDAVIGPLNVAAEYVDRISHGDIPEKITDNYNGDFNEIKNNLNTCIDAINMLVADSQILERAAVEGRLATRADVSVHKGKFRSIVEGVNLTLDAVIGPLNVAAEYVDRISHGDIPDKITDNYNGDFNEIKNNLNQCIDTLNGLLSDMYNMSEEHNKGDIDVVMPVDKFTGAYQTMAIGVNEMVAGHISVKKKAMATVSEFSRGNFDAPLEKFPGKKAFINENIELLRTNLKALVADANLLAQAAVEGRLDTRADASKHDGDFRAIVKGVNDTLDAVIGPLNVAAEYVDRISHGDIPDKITDNYNGDFNEIKNNLNTCIDAVNLLVADANLLVQAAVEGRLDTRADASKHDGDFRAIVKGVNDTLDAVIGPLNVAAEYVDRISHGDIPDKITDNYNGDFNEIKNNLNTCIDAVNLLVADANLLAQAAVEGRLDTRADASKHDGDFRAIVKGVNDTLDAVIGPLNVAADYVDRISKGDIPARITDNYNGDFNAIKNNLNTCIDAVNLLVADANLLAQAAVEGRLDTRADASKHDGDFRAIVKGVNDTLDAVIGPLNVAAEYVDRISHGDIPDKITDNYNGDFNEIKNNLNTCIDAVNLLVADANLLAQAAVEGRLDTRADASKHDGDFRAIVKGVNDTLDAVIKPVTEAADVLVEMEKGNLGVSVRGDYQGDHALIKNSLNGTITALKAYVNEISMVLTEMAQGNLDVAIKQDFRGDFAAIKDSLNYIIASFNETLSGINNASGQVADGSNQVAKSSQMLAQGAAEQSSSVEELTASITQIAAQTNQNAAYANQANELALKARDNATDGNEQMKNMLDAMEAINESSNNISKIIKVIDEIAFQTNILALNAAVEAARAGQHGKGFAVVAEEVRNLAARSASAARETTEMIEGSIKKTEAGTKIANDTAAALGHIVEGVTQVASLVGDIAIASNEQATGIAQIDKGVEQISIVVQTNAATAEQSAAASEELSSQADLLKEQVAKFNLKKQNGQTKLSELSPEILSLLQDLAGKQDLSQLLNNTGAVNHQAYNQTPRVQISLSDNDFGKY